MIMETEGRINLQVMAGEKKTVGQPQRKKAAQSTSSQKRWVTCIHYFQSLTLHLQSKCSALGTGEYWQGPIRGGSGARWAWTNWPHQVDDSWQLLRSPSKSHCTAWVISFEPGSPEQVIPTVKWPGLVSARYELEAAICFLSCSSQNLSNSPLSTVVMVLISPFPSVDMVPGFQG